VLPALRSVALFVLAALAEIGGGWLVWQGVWEHRGWPWIALGDAVLFLYGLIPTLQPMPYFGRVYAAYGGFLLRALPGVGAAGGPLAARPLGPARRGGSTAGGGAHALRTAAGMNPCLGRLWPAGTATRPRARHR